MKRKQKVILKKYNSKLQTYGIDKDYYIEVYYRNPHIVSDVFDDGFITLERGLGYTWSPNLFENDLLAETLLTEKDFEL